MSKPREMHEEAEAIRCLLLACENGPLKSTANYWRKKLERAALRLEDAARTITAREGRRS